MLTAMKKKRASFKEDIEDDEPPKDIATDLLINGRDLGATEDLKVQQNFAVDIHQGSSLPAPAKNRIAERKAATMVVTYSGTVSAANVLKTVSSTKVGPAMATTQRSGGKVPNASVSATTLEIGKDEIMNLGSGLSASKKAPATFSNHHDEATQVTWLSNEAGSVIVGKVFVIQSSTGSFARTLDNSHQEGNARCAAISTLPIFESQDVGSTMKRKKMKHVNVIPGSLKVWPPPSPFWVLSWAADVHPLHFVHAEGSRRLTLALFTRGSCRQGWWWCVVVVMGYG
jgi:hypothetical protein